MSAQSRIVAGQICNPPRGPTRSGKSAVIRARDIMTKPVTVIGPEDTVRDAARLLSEDRISALPVLEKGKVLGIVSQGDLLQRKELGTGPGVSGRAFPGSNFDYAKSHGHTVRDVMTPRIVTVRENEALGDVVEALQSNNVRRVLVMRGDKPVGIVSRTDIVNALAGRPEDSAGPLDSDDDIIRFKVVETLLDIPGTSPWLGSVAVSDGVVELRGVLEDETKRDPSRIAIESLPHVVTVRDLRTTLQPY